MRYFRLLLLMLRVSIQNDAAYRLDFFIQFGSAVGHVAAMLLAADVIYGQTTEINGWSFTQYVALLGVFRIMSGLIGLMIAPNMRRIMEDVREGTLDFILLKPVDSQFFASTRVFVLGRSADVLMGLCLIAGSVWKLGSHLSGHSIMLFLIMLAAGTTIIYSFWLVLATLSFWLVKVQNIEMIFWNVFEAARYPVTIYGAPIRFVLTYILPVAFVVTIPAQALVGGAGEGVEQLGTGALVAALLVAPAMLTVATLFWRYGLRNYSGASA